MGRKIFVSYKYWDGNVAELPIDFREHYGYPIARDYVNYIEKKIDYTSNIYKGEGSDEDLSDKSKEYIERHLRDKIYDSSVTIVLISPNMKEPNKWEKSQWIPWEISYSLKETTCSDRTSHSNAVLAVVLPDANNSYEYYRRLPLFDILQHNISCDYIPVVKWITFINSMEGCIALAEDRKKEVSRYLLQIEV